MKLKLQLLITCLLILTSYNAKSQNITGYIDNDVQKLQAFFDLPNGATTNGLKMSSGYISGDPTTWTAVTWDGSSPNQNVLSIVLDSLNLVGDLDCSNFNGLTYLDCAYNKITSVNLHLSPKLTTLFCDSNQLQSLDVSQNPNLFTLSCSLNKLTALNVTQNTNLSHLTCRYNQLTGLDLTQNAALTTLYCDSNKLTALNVDAAGTNLTTLVCGNNQISSLNVLQNTNLTDFSCPSNYITSLDVHLNTALNHFTCSHNLLTTLDVDANINLTTLYCDQNQITDLKVNTNDKLTTLICRYNQLPILDVSNATALTAFSCSYNNLTSINVTKNIALKNFTCSFNNITSLDVSKNTALTTLYCGYNQIPILNVDANTSLTDIYCPNNQLTALNVDKNTLLRFLSCADNNLTSLNLTANTALMNLSCYNNELKFSDLRYNSYTDTIASLSPQRPFIPLGVTTTGGTMAAALGDTINLTKETNINAVMGNTPNITTFHIWKKAADNTITEVTSQCTFTNAIGYIKLPLAANQGDSLFITMSNPTDTGFTTQTAAVTPLTTTMRTRTFALVGASLLPIELLSFTANLNTNKVYLAWSTASEKNNAFFTVERSINNQNWESVAKVNGAGNSNTQLNYSTIDANPLSGVSYYRLKQTDFDGKFEYSKTVVINRNAKTAIQLYPNPATNEIYVTGNEDDLNSIKIYNSLGQDVTKYTNYSASNTKQIKIDISKLTTGIYILKTKNTTNKLIVK